jgi:Domain of unknown function (DUF4383)
MQTRLFALGLGLFYLIVGIVAFVPALYTAPGASAPHVDVTTSYGLFLGLFPVNAVIDSINIVIGLAGILASARVASARYYCMLMFLLFGLSTIAGFLPQANTLWGAAPLWEYDTWIHAGSALAAGYFGFVALEPTHVEPALAHQH